MGRLYTRENFHQVKRVQLTRGLRSEATAPGITSITSHQFRDPAIVVLFDFQGCQLFESNQLTHSDLSPVTSQRVSSVRELELNEDRLVTFRTIVKSSIISKLAVSMR